MLDKKLKRRRRATKGRAKIRGLRIARLCVVRSAKHVYAQILMPAEKGDRVLVSASTLHKEVKNRVRGADQAEKSSKIAFNNVKSAAIVGGMIAEMALAVGINRVAFDRSGFKYHGQIKALAEAAREAGLHF